LQKKSPAHHPKQVFRGAIKTDPQKTDEGPVSLCGIVPEKMGRNKNSKDVTEIVKKYYIGL
jgi:hypothetical protein